MTLATRIKKLENSSSKYVSSATIFGLASVTTYVFYEYWALIPLSISILMIYEAHKLKKEIVKEKEDFLELKVNEVVSYMANIFNENKIEYFDLLNECSDGVNMKLYFLKALFALNKEQIKKSIFKYEDSIQIRYLSAYILCNFNSISTEDTFKYDTLNLLVFIMKDFDRENANNIESSIILLSEHALAKYVEEKEFDT